MLLEVLKRREQALALSGHGWADSAAVQCSEHCGDLRGYLFQHFHLQDSDRPRDYQRSPECEHLKSSSVQCAPVPSVKALMLRAWPVQTAIGCSYAGSCPSLLLDF